MGRMGTVTETYRTEHYEMTVGRRRADISRRTRFDREQGREVPPVECLAGDMHARIVFDGRLNVRQLFDYAKFIERIAVEVEGMQQHARTEWAVMDAGVCLAPCPCGGTPVVERGKKTYERGVIVTREMKVHCPACGRTVSASGFGLGGVREADITRQAIEEWDKEGETRR